MKTVLVFLAALICIPVALSAAGCPEGTQIGWMAIRVQGDEKPWVRTNLIQGADPSELARGLGHWPETRMPGDGGRIAFSGHRTTYGAWLHDLDEFPQRRTILRLHMSWPKKQSFCYKLTGVRIVSAYDTSPAYSSDPREVVVTFACHPKGQMSHRIVGFWWRISCSAAGA